MKDSDKILRSLRQKGSALVSRRQFLALAGTAAGAIALGPVMGRTPASPTSWWVPEEHRAHVRTWMAWPDNRKIYTLKQLKKLQSNVALIAKTIAKYEEVILCANRASVSAARMKCGPSVTVIGSIPVDDLWMRDTGPIFRINGSGGRDAIGLNFNGWGWETHILRDRLVAERIAAYVGVPFSTASVVGEGGGIDYDGNGLLLAAESSWVNPNRNPGQTRAAIEASLLTAFGAGKMIWTKGIIGQDSTDCHIDGYARLYGPSKSMVQIPVEGTYPHDIWAREARAAREILESSTDLNGNPLDVTLTYWPDYWKVRPGLDDGMYANYYPCNGAVICMNTGDIATDNRTKATLQTMYPGRVVEMINVDNLVKIGGGGIHCATMQEPHP